MNANLKKLQQNWCGARIAILGFGREGQDTFLFLRKLFPQKTIGVADVKYKIPNTKYKIQNVKWHLGKNYLQSLKNYDVIIKSPGIPFKILPKSILKKITTQTEIFFDNCPGIIVGITGTKGKSTTTSMIYDILKAGGIKAHLVGNIGKPVLNLLFSATPKDIYVYELSSHQLMNLKKSPHIAVLLNIYPEHLDYYNNFKEYASAKANITLHQTKNDYLVYNFQDPLVRKIAEKSTLRHSSGQEPRKISIVGEYYDLDKAAAVEVGKIFKIPKEKIAKAIKNFKFLPHRLELVGTFKGITFYDDAIATIPQATIAAIDKLGDKVETIFLGGFDRKIDFKELAKAVLKSKIKNVILFPTTGEKIRQTIVKTAKNKKIPQFFPADNMKDAVKLAFEHTKKGKICLLSCASSSFSIFKDYKEKGNLFKKYVKYFGR